MAKKQVKKQLDVKSSGTESAAKRRRTEPKKATSGAPVSAQAVVESIEVSLPTRSATVAQRVCEIVHKQTGAPNDEMLLKKHLVDDLNCDSLDVVEIEMELEDEFEIGISDETWARICMQPVQKIIEEIRVLTGLEA